jgi:hypothetical protein
MKSGLLVSMLLYVSTLVGQTLFLETNNVDEFTGVKRYGTNLVKVANSERPGLGHLKMVVFRNLSPDSTVEDILRVLPSADMGCSGSHTNYIHFLFEDGSTIIYNKDIAPIRCDYLASPAFLIEPSDFTGKVIRKVRFCMTEGYNDYVWTYSVGLDAFTRMLPSN